MPSTTETSPSWPALQAIRAPEQAREGPPSGCYARLLAPPARYRMSRFFKSAAFPILIVVVLAFFAQKLITPGQPAEKPTFGEFLTQLQDDQLQTVDVKTKQNVIDVTDKSGKKYEVGYPDFYANTLVNKLQTAEKAPGSDLKFDVEPAKSNGWLSLLTYVLPFIIFIGFWIFLMNQVQGGGSKVMSFGKSRAKRLSVDSPKITFRDV